MFEQFVKERIYLKNVAPKTVAFYWQSWSAFQRHHHGEISKQSLKQFVTNMREAGIKPVSCNTYISCINAYLKWRHEEHGSELFKIQSREENSGNVWTNRITSSNPVQTLRRG